MKVGRSGGGGERGVRIGGADAEWRKSGGGRGGILMGACLCVRRQMRIYTPQSVASSPVHSPVNLSSVSQPHHIWQKHRSVVFESLQRLGSAHESAAVFLHLQ